MKKILTGIAIASAVLALILISLKAYYVLITILAGSILIGYREFWSLIKTGRLPPFDERVRQNMNRSIRNGFLFFIIASIFLMLFFSVNQKWKPEILHVLGSLFVSAAAVYFLSFIFYDRSEPKLSGSDLKTLKTFLILLESSAAAFVLSVLLHNLISGLFNIEEAVFFIIATIVAPMALVTGLAGCLFYLIRGLIRRE